MFLSTKSSARIILCLVIASSVLCDVERVSPSVRECDHKGSTLFCDFKNSEKDVIVDNLSGMSIKMLFLYNARTVFVNESACVNMAFNNVEKVFMNSKETPECEEKLELSIKHVTLDRVPGHVSKVYLEASSLKSLVSNKPLSKLTIISSNISLLHASLLLDDGTSAMFQESNIEELENLRIQNRSSVLFYKTVINSIKPEGLIVYPEGEVIFRNSAVNTIYDNGLVMFSKARIKFEQGSDVNFMGTKENLDVPETTSKSFLLLFIVFVILFIISFMFNILCVVYIVKSRKQSAGDNHNINKEDENDKESDLEAITENKDSPASEEIPLMSENSCIGQSDVLFRKLEGQVKEIKSGWDAYKLKNESICKSFEVRFKEKAEQLSNDHKLSKLKIEEEQVLKEKKASKITAEKANSKIETIQNKIKTASQTVTNKIDKEKCDHNTKVISNYVILIEKTEKIKDNTNSAWQEITTSINDIIKSSFDDNDSLKRLQYSFGDFCSSLKFAYENKLSEIKTSEEKDKLKNSYENELRSQETQINLQKSYLKLFEETLQNILDFHILLLKIVKNLSSAETVEFL